MTSSIFSPLPETGWAAPMCVPGAMAAMSAAIVIRKPADAARFPDGPTKTATGVFALMIALLMSRVESRRPPGVRSVITSSAACSASARETAPRMNSAATGWMMPSTVADSTIGLSVMAAATAPPMSSVPHAISRAMRIMATSLVVGRLVDGRGRSRCVPVEQPDSEIWWRADRCAPEDAWHPPTRGRAPAPAAPEGARCRDP